MYSAGYMNIARSAPYARQLNSRMKDWCGFLFVRYKRHFCTELISWEYVACPLSGIKRRPLVGGWLNTSCIVVSIRAIASVRYREVVRSWEGPLLEIPLYSYIAGGREGGRERDTHT